MQTTFETAGLTKGLRALGTLAIHAPVGPVEFAAASGLGLAEAAELLETFEAYGYARRVPGGSLYVLTRLARTLMGNVGRAGRVQGASAMVH